MRSGVSNFIPLGGERERESDKTNSIMNWHNKVSIAFILGRKAQCVATEGTEGASVHLATIKHVKGALWVTTLIEYRQDNSGLVH